MQAITVYCASSTFLDPAFHGPAQRLGAELAARSLRLVYGGGGVGLMGDVARATKAAGGAVTGVITTALFDREQGWDGCDELLVVDTMGIRKREMMASGDAFIALPGGLGTFEELFEVITAHVVGEHSKPIGIVNSDGYYTPMIEMIDHGIEHKFIKPAVHELLCVDADPVAVVEKVLAAEGHEVDDARLFPSGQLQ